MLENPTCQHKGIIFTLGINNIWQSMDKNRYDTQDPNAILEQYNILLETTKQSYADAHTYVCSILTKQWRYQRRTNSINKHLATAAKTIANLTYIDTRSDMASHTHAFKSDGIHLTQEGTEKLICILQNYILGASSRTSTLARPEYHLQGRWQQARPHPSH